MHWNRAFNLGYRGNCVTSTALQNKPKSSLRQQSVHSQTNFGCVGKALSPHSAPDQIPQNSDLALTELSCVPFKSPLVAPDTPDLSLQNICVRVPRNFLAPNTYTSGSIAPFRHVRHEVRRLAKVRPLRVWQDVSTCLYPRMKVALLTW